MFFCDFWRSKSWFLVILEALGGPFGSFWRLFAHFEDFWDCGDFGCSLGTKVDITFGVILELLSHFWQCCFFSVFLSARFSCFLWFWVARGSILAPILPHFWDPLAFVKSVKSVQLCSISEVWPLPDRVFLQALIADAFWWRLFVDFCDFGLFWGSHFETFWHQFSQKMRFEKKRQKVWKSGDATKIGWGACGPLKRQENQTSDSRQQTNDSNTPWRA